MPLILRPETPADADAIEQVTHAAFLVHPHSRQTEQFIVRDLRAAGDLTLSLVAEEAGRVVGHIAFSPVAIPGGAAGWYGVGPVSVMPERQRRGIGGALVRAGLERLRALGARGCVLVGDPGFYGRFGFVRAEGMRLKGVPPEVLLALAFSGGAPRGEVRFHPAFAATE